MSARDANGTVRVVNATQYWDGSQVQTVSDASSLTGINAVTVPGSGGTNLPAYQMVGNDSRGSGATWSVNPASGQLGLAEEFSPRISSDWQNVTPYGINDSNVVVAVATYSGTNSAIPSGQHAVLLIPDTIQRDGQIINSTNNTVCVGQQINLTNMISGVPTNSITYWKWSIPGANGNTNTDTAIYDYEPSVNNSNYTNLVTPTNYLTNSSGIPFCHFYWTAGGTNQVSCTTVIYGQTNTVTATINVLRPSNVQLTATNQSPIQVSTSYVYAYNPVTGAPLSGPPFLCYGLDIVPGQSGIDFTQTNSAPPGFAGSAEWVQVINGAAITNNTTGHTNPGGCDTGYPYPASISQGEAIDSPSDPLFAWTNSSEHFDATMYLMWRPYSTNAAVNGDNTVWVPIRSYQWNWSGSATNSSPSTNTGWMLTSSNYPTDTATNVDATNEPTWSTNAVNNWNPPFSYPTP